uniref:Uncharacterized protein n=1 Tax=Anopheles dirus TaxID=7168 RepID=A0A182NGL4_9DIPT
MCPDRSGRFGTFLLLLVLAVVRIESLPVTSLLDDDSSDYDDFYDDDYDIVFDQRQNGTANVHLSVDGVMVALPAPEMPPSAALAGATLLDLFASQLAAAGGESEDSDSSEESYGGVGSSPAGSTSTSTSTTTTTSTTTVAPAAGSSIASDFPYQTLGAGGLPANLPASLLGQGLSFLFNTKRAEIPFRVNAGAEPANPAVLPVLITKVEKAPVKAAAVDSDESNEESHEVGEPAPQQAPKQHAGKKKRKHKRKYKVRVANLLRPLLQRTVLIQ